MGLVVAEEVIAGFVFVLNYCVWFVSVNVNVARVPKYIFFPPLTYIVHVTYLKGS